jgi:hypothetical protein
VSSPPSHPAASPPLSPLLRYSILGSLFVFRS